MKKRTRITWIVVDRSLLVTRQFLFGLLVLISLDSSIELLLLYKEVIDEGFLD